MDGWRRRDRLFRSHRGYFHVQSLSPCSSVCIVRLLMSMFMLTHRIWTDAVEVIKEDQTVVTGGTTVLPCKLINSHEDLTQISWQRKTQGKPQNDNFYTINGGPRFVNGHDNRFTFAGNMAEKNGSLKLSDVTLLDDGVYTCIFTLFPTGNYQAEIHLNVHVPPVTHVEGTFPVVGDEEVSLATCTAAKSKPPAVVTWKTGTLGEKVRTTETSTLHADGTTTTVSSLWGVPTREISGTPVQCVITTPALPNEKTLPFTIQVNYPPGEVSVNHTSRSSFQCVAQANPPPQFTWSRPGQSPAVEGSTLENADEDGLYQCGASNQYGSGHVYLYVHTKPGSCKACEAILAILLILFVIGVLAFGYFYKSKDWEFDLPKRKSPRNEEGPATERQPVRTASDESELRDVNEALT